MWLTSRRLAVTQHSHNKFGQLIYLPNILSTKWRVIVHFPGELLSSSFSLSRENKMVYMKSSIIMKSYLLNRQSGKVTMVEQLKSQAASPITGVIVEFNRFIANFAQLLGITMAYQLPQWYQLSM